MGELIDYCHFTIVHTHDKNPLVISIKPQSMWLKVLKNWRIQQSSGRNTLHDQVIEAANNFTKNYKGTQKLFSKLYNPSFTEDTEKLIRSFLEKRAEIIKIYSSTQQLFAKHEELAWEIFDYCGIFLSESSKESIRNGQYTCPYMSNRPLINHFSFTNSGYPTGLFSSILYDLIGKNTYKLYFTNKEFERRNPLYWNRDIMYLARFESEKIIAHDIENIDRQNHIINNITLNSKFNVINKLKCEGDLFKKKLTKICGTSQYYLGLVNGNQNSYDLVFVDKINIGQENQSNYVLLNSLTDRQMAIMSCQFYLNNDYKKTFLDYEKLNENYVIHHNVEAHSINLNNSFFRDDLNIYLVCHDYPMPLFNNLFESEVKFIFNKKIDYFPITKELNYDDIFSTLMSDNIGQDYDSELIFNDSNRNKYYSLIRDLVKSKIEEIINEFNNLKITFEDIIYSPIKINKPVGNDSVFCDGSLFNGREFYDNKNGIMLNSQLKECYESDYLNKNKQSLIIWLNFRLSEWCFHYELKLLRYFINKLID